jgi:hypothetical protein
VRSPLLHKCLALLLGWNYFAFQVELFENEYEKNNPIPVTTCSLSTPTLTWESFDKNNAPQPFVFDAGLHIDCILVFGEQPLVERCTDRPSHPVRDKSPPSCFDSFSVFAQA